MQHSVPALQIEPTYATNGKAIALPNSSRTTELLSGYDGRQARDNRRTDLADLACTQTLWNTETPCITLLVSFYEIYLTFKVIVEFP